MEIVDLRTLRPLDDETHHRLGAQDAPGRRARGGRGLRGHGRRDRGPHHRAGLRRARRAGRAGDRPRRRHAVRREPRAAEDAVRRSASSRPSAASRYANEGAADMAVTKVDDAASSPTRWRPARSSSGSRRKATRSRRGDILAEVETDKANVEIEAFGSGVLRKILVAEGGRRRSASSSRDRRAGRGHRRSVAARPARAAPAAPAAPAAAAAAAPAPAPRPAPAAAPAAAAAAGAARRDGEPPSRCPRRPRPPCRWPRRPPAGRAAGGPRQGLAARAQDRGADRASISRADPGHRPGRTHRPSATSRRPASPRAAARRPPRRAARGGARAPRASARRGRGVRGRPAQPMRAAIAKRMPSRRRRSRTST